MDPRIVTLSDAIPPHVTLLSPWDLGPASDQAATRLRQATRSVAPFRLWFDSVATLPTGTVYLQPQRSPELHALFETLTKAFPVLAPQGGAGAE